MADSREQGIDHRCGNCWQFINSNSDGRVLPCKQICCMSCLKEEHEEKKGVWCNGCSIFHKITNVADVPKFLVRRAQATTVKFVCDRKGCVDKPATTYCVNCELKLCGDHSQVHQTLFDDEHEVAPIPELEDSPKKYTKVFCVRHKKQQIKKACKDCNSFFCDDCETSGRCSGCTTGHQIKSLSTLTEQIDVEYKQLLKSADDKITAMCQSRKKSWTNLDVEEEKCKKWINEIKHIRDEQIETIREDSHKAIRKVEEYRQMVTNQAEVFEVELMEKKEQLEEFRAKVHRLTRDENVTELMRQKQQITEELIRNLDVEIGIWVLPAQHELIYNGQTAHLDVDFLSIPSSLELQSKHDVGSSCYSAWYRANGDVLIGCEDGVRVFDVKSQSLTKYDTKFVTVVSVIEHHQLTYVLHRNNKVSYVDLCTDELEKIETLFEFADDSGKAPTMTVSDKYIVVYVPPGSVPRRIIVYDFATKNCTSSRGMDIKWPHFLPDGTVLTSGDNKLTKSNINNRALVPVWECGGLTNIRTVSTDARGLVYSFTYRDQKCIYIVSPSGQKLCELRHDFLPEVMGVGSVCGDQIAVPGWGGNTLSFYQLK